MAGDYIILQPDFVNWEWYTDANTQRLFMHLLFKCCHEDSNFCGTHIRSGQCITSLTGLMSELKMTKSEIRTALRHLTYSGFVDAKTTPRWTLITINKWSKYQPEDTRRAVMTGVPRSFDEVEEYIRRMNLNVNAYEFISYYDEHEWRDRDGKIIRDWKKMLQKWSKK